MRLWWRQTAGLAGAAALCALCLVAPALAQAQGDGSGTDNERLLPNVYPADPVLSSGEWLREPHDPFFDVDWSVALRGSYTKSTSGERFDILLAPSARLEHVGSRSAVNFDASGEIVRPSGDGRIDIGALRLGLQTGYDLDSATRLTANGNLSLTRATPGSPGLADTIVIAPQTTSGGFDAGITRQFGAFNIGLTGAAQRHVYGETTLATGAVTDNSEQNYWALDSGLRVGFQATPIFEVFGRAGLGRDIFDRPSTALAAYPNATDVTLEGGVTGRWNDILEVTASTGVGLRRFDVAGLDEVVTQLYGAQVSFTPDPTWRMTAGFATNVAPPGPNAGGTARVDYSANADVAYTVNSWLRLRALADWYSTRYAGSTNTETGYGLGAGADYKVNAHTALSADYGYDYAESTVNGVQDAHRVTVGVTLSR